MDKERTALIMTFAVPSHGFQISKSLFGLHYFAWKLANTSILKLMNDMVEDCVGKGSEGLQN
jgi:hypothetical protein